MGKIEAFEGFKDSKELTVVRGEGDAELGLVGGVLGGHKLNVGVGARVKFGDRCLGTLLDDTIGGHI